MTNLQTIADKISKIIAKADSTTNPEEADTFMAKAQQLLQEHGLSLIDIGKLESNDPIGVTKRAATVPGAYNCASMVANQLAIYYGCQLVTSVVMVDGKKIQSFSVAGRESARVTFQLMMPFVWRQTMALAREGFNTGGYKNRMQALTFVANALSLRLHKLNKRDSDVRAKQPSNSGLNQLVPYDEIGRALEEAFTNLKDARSRVLKTNAQSQALANKVSLNKQTTAANPSRRIGA